ncbi:MAG: hypothetical protein Q4A70_02865 [Candidatus Saccharibacteria bacterium]|nr:hypothetical protein [Candidatus Saccharibacteria bacterium]
MKEKDGNKKKKQIIYAVIIALIAGLIALIIFLLTYKKETHIYENYDDANLSSLACSITSTPESSFFENSAKSIKHEVKIVFTNDVIDKMSYEFRGEYESWSDADADEGVLHAKYNNYMGEHGLEHSMLTPIFQNVDGELKISLYLDSYKDMNSTIAKLFYIGEGSMNVIAKNSITETKKYYEKKGFSCIIND